jgi:hypothetical protein
VAEPLYYCAATHLAAEAKRLLKEQVRVRDEQVELVKSVAVSNAAFKPGDVRRGARGSGCCPLMPRPAHAARPSQTVLYLGSGGIFVACIWFLNIAISATLRFECSLNLDKAMGWRSRINGAQSGVAEPAEKSWLNVSLSVLRSIMVSIHVLARGLRVS